MIQEQILCEYGCGQEGKYRFKNGKWCCSENWTKCPSQKERKSISAKKFILEHPGCRSKENHPLWNKKHKQESLEKMKLSHAGCIKPLPEIVETTELCSFGCGQKAKYKYRSGNFCCSETFEKCPEYRRKTGLKSIGRKIWSDQKKEEKRQNFINGQAAYMNTFITNDSKPENELFKIICKLLPRPIHKFPIYRGKGKRNYTADIADPSLGIILEFDGYYHFHTEERKQKDNERQQEIEEDGWKFLRYNIFQKFPTLEQVKEDVLRTIKND